MLIGNVAYRQILHVTYVISSAILLSIDSAGAIAAQEKKPGLSATLSFPLRSLSNLRGSVVGLPRKIPGVNAIFLPG